MEWGLIGLGFFSFFLTRFQCFDSVKDRIYNHICFLGFRVALTIPCIVSQEIMKSRCNF
jgi:hypothetical protein